MISSAIFVYPHKFLRSANLWAHIAIYGTYFSHYRFHLCVINMAAIPGQKIINIMYGCYCDMKGVIQRFFRKCAFLEERF